ncbi:hypothetical protein CDV31_011207 [Fusarium ambrosium]|uniref:Uncharacterized protein n=1 Tax=Fusarium ambrosium TaxID=131363 RepID=A0A428TI73_9HYPO|nr:hypothetical protein CDV31_011207 [Fusarium ambrosium]
MQSPSQVQVPRPGQPTSGFAHQSNGYSPAINAWLRQEGTEVPWHNLASIVVPSTSQDTSHSGSVALPSDNAATQGSVRHDGFDTGMNMTHPKDTSSSNIHTRLPSMSVPAYSQQQERTNTNQGPQTDKDTS